MTLKKQLFDMFFFVGLNSSDDVKLHQHFNPSKMYEMPKFLAMTLTQWTFYLQCSCSHIYENQTLNH